MNPKFDYFLHNLHGQSFGFHSSIYFLKATALVNSFYSEDTLSQVLGPKYEIISFPWKTDLAFGIANSELIRKL